MSKPHVQRGILGYPHIQRGTSIIPRDVNGELFGPTEPQFDGPGLEPHDHKRLSKQLQALFTILTSIPEYPWWTLAELAGRMQAPEASVSARLRDLRKPKFGGHTIERRRCHRNGGQYEYRLAPLDTVSAED